MVMEKLHFLKTLKIFDILKKCGKNSFFERFVLTFLYSCSGVTDLSKAMLIMELPVGANKEKKAAGMKNLEYMLDNAHAVRSPGAHHLNGVLPYFVKKRIVDQNNKQKV